MPGFQCCLFPCSLLIFKGFLQAQRAAGINSSSQLNLFPSLFQINAKSALFLSISSVLHPGQGLLRDRGGLLTSLHPYECLYLFLCCLFYLQVNQSLLQYLSVYGASITVTVSHDTGCGHHSPIICNLIISFSMLSYQSIPRGFSNQ